MLAANPPTAANPAAPPQCHAAHPRRRVADRQRYMSRPFLITFAGTLVASFFLVAVSVRGQSEEPMSQQAQATVPTGIYSVVFPVRLTLTLETNNTYELRSDLSAQSGKWKWDSKKQEFRLTPMGKEFPFDVRRLRVDRDNPKYLQWVPVEPVLGSTSGTIDWLRLKHQ
jgi:hypothetical protein